MVNCFGPSKLPVHARFKQRNLHSSECSGSDHLRPALCHMLPHLPPRLSPVADAALHSLGQETVCIADVGCYKALLAIHLVQRDARVRVVATDLASGPLELGRMMADSLTSEQSKRIDFRLGDGLSALSPGEVDVVCIAGIAAGKLSTWIPSTQFAKRLVLQPSVPTAPEAMMQLRRALRGHGWALKDEALSVEKGGVCLTLVAEADEGISGEVGPQILPTAARSRIWQQLQNGTQDDVEASAYLELLHEYLARTPEGKLCEALQEELASLSMLLKRD